MNMVCYAQVPQLEGFLAQGRGASSTLFVDTMHSCVVSVNTNTTLPSNWGRKARQTSLTALSSLTFMCNQYLRGDHIHTLGPEVC